MKALATNAMILPALFAVCGVLSAADLPTAFPSARYQGMIEKSPFSPGTAAPAPTPPPPAADSFTKDFYLVGIAKLGNQDFVSIASKVDQTQRFSIFVGEQGPDGISVASVMHEPGMAKSKVMLKKGTEFGTITFDEAAQAAPPVEGQPPPMPPQPIGGIQKQRPPLRNGYQPPAMANRMPQNRSVVPNVRPFRPGVNPAGAPGMPQSRIRRSVIPSPR